MIKNPSFLRIILFPLLLIILAPGHMIADGGKGIDFDPDLKFKKSTNTGDKTAIVIQTDVGNLEIRTRAHETSTQKGWRAVPSKDSVSPSSGPEITRSYTYDFPDGTIVTDNLTVKSGPSNVDVKFTYSAPHPTPGFFYSILGMPKEMAEDASIFDENGDNIFPDKKTPCEVKLASQLTFRNRSTGQFLFKVSGDYSSVVVEFHPSNPEWGLNLLITSVPNAKESKIGDLVETNWKISFKE